MDDVSGSIDKLNSKLDAFIDSLDKASDVLKPEDESTHADIIDMLRQIITQNERMMQKLGEIVQLLRGQQPRQPQPIQPQPMPPMPMYQQPMQQMQQQQYPQPFTPSFNQPIVHREMPEHLPPPPPPMFMGAEKPKKSLSLFGR